MTDYEVFEKNWERAVNGLVGRISNDGRDFYTRREINEMWQEELVTNRFCSMEIRDEAQIFLEELFERRTDVAKRLQDKLRASRLDAGIDVENVAVKGAVALGATAVAVCAWNSKMGVVRKALSTTLSAGTAACFAGDTAKGLFSGISQAIIRDIRVKASKQLEGYRILLEE